MLGLLAQPVYFRSLRIRVSFLSLPAYLHNYPSHIYVKYYGFHCTNKAIILIIIDCFPHFGRTVSDMVLNVSHCHTSDTVTLIKRQNAMPSIPVDVLRDILEHVDGADLATICQLNKICCYYSQDVLYRHINLEYNSAPIRQRQLYQTLAQSTHLAERVLWIHVIVSDSSIVETVAKALRNMSSLRHLFLSGSFSNVLDGCTFKLYSLACGHSEGDSESIINFLRNQTSITDITFYQLDPSVSIEATCLPNLTRVESSSLYCASQLIPGRPVSEVSIVSPPIKTSADLSFFTLSTVPLQKLTINCSYLYPRSGGFLASIFPSLKELTFFISLRNTDISHPVSVSFYSFLN